MTSTRRTHAIVSVVLAALTGACSEGGAPPAAAPVAPPAAPAEVLPQETAAPAPPAARPLDEGAVRALAEEVARLRAQLAEMQKAKAEVPAAPVNLVERAGGDAAREPRVAADEQFAQPVGGDPGYDEGAAPEPTTTVIEYETVVEVPVVEREVVYERDYVLEEVCCGDLACEQWVPPHHVHYIGCGHHYYGCPCHPWYYDLRPSVCLTIHVVPDRHRDGDRRDADHREHRGDRDTAGRPHRKPAASGADGAIPTSPATAATPSSPVLATTAPAPTPTVAAIPTSAVVTTPANDRTRPRDRGEDAPRRPRPDRLPRSPLLNPVGATAVAETPAPAPPVAGAVAPNAREPEDARPRERHRDREPDADRTSPRDREERRPEHHERPQRQAPALETPAASPPPAPSPPPPPPPPPAHHHQKK